MIDGFNVNCSIFLHGKSFQNIKHYFIHIAFLLGQDTWVFQDVIIPAGTIYFEFYSVRGDSVINPRGDMAIDSILTSGGQGSGPAPTPAPATPAPATPAPATPAPATPAPGYYIITPKIKEYFILILNTYYLNQCCDIIV